VIEMLAQDSNGGQRDAAFISWDLSDVSYGAPHGRLYLGARNSQYTGITILDNGIVGIGCTPTRALDVAGTIQTSSDVSITTAAKGLVLKDTQTTPHYWRVTINNSGTLITTDIGTSAP
jgi:hypothetical protein